MNEPVECVAQAIAFERLTRPAPRSPENLATFMRTCWDRQEPGDEEKRDQFRAEARAALAAISEAEPEGRFVCLAPAPVGWSWVLTPVTEAWPPYEGVATTSASDGEAALLRPN